MDDRLMKYRQYSAELEYLRREEGILLATSQFLPVKAMTVSVPREKLKDLLELSIKALSEPQTEPHLNR